MMSAVLSKRLTMYWQMELVSSVLIPTVFILFMLTTNSAFGWFAFVCYLPAFVLLLLGARYWYSKLEHIKGDSVPLKQLLPIARMLRIPLLSTCIIAFAMCIGELFNPISVSTLDCVGGLVFTTLAILEFINYYVVQLQHFDHWPDFVRLISGRGFRKSHLRRDLEKLTNC